MIFYLKSLPPPPVHKVHNYKIIFSSKKNLIFLHRIYKKIAYLLYRYITYIYNVCVCDTNKQLLSICLIVLVWAFHNFRHVKSISVRKKLV